MLKKRYKILRHILRKNRTFDEIARFLGHTSFKELQKSIEYGEIFNEDFYKCVYTNASECAITGSTTVSINAYGMNAVENRATENRRWRIPTGISIAALMLSVIALLAQIFEW